METRKIYVSGGSTYVMSLPKKWVIKEGLKPGDSLMVTEQGDSLLIETKIKEKEPFIKHIKISEVLSNDALERKLIAFYLVGYDTIKIRLDKKNNLSYRNTIRKILGYLIGVEIVEDINEYMTLEIMVDYKRMKTTQILHRMFHIEMSMIYDIKKALKNKDTELLKEIIIREKETDKLYFLVVRQLKNAVLYPQITQKLGIKNNRDCLGYRIVVKVFERIADHIEIIANTYTQLLKVQKQPDLKEFIKLIDSISRVFSDSVQALFNRDSKLAEMVFQELEDVKKSLYDISNKLFYIDDIQSAILQKTMLDSLERIAGYSEDIAEMSINMSID